MNSKRYGEIIHLLRKNFVLQGKRSLQLTPSFAMSMTKAFYANKKWSFDKILVYCIVEHCQPISTDDIVDSCIVLSAYIEACKNAR